MRGGGGDTYYWAGGRKVPLRASTDVVLDLGSPAGTRLSGAQLERLRRGGRSLSASLLMVPESEAAAALGEDHTSVPGVHPVFHTGDGALVVVLPQVRVESADPQRLAAVGRSLTDARVVEHTEERLVLEPDSGRGADALRLANSLAESRAADVSSARFLRVVSRPGPR